jgi:hypothetical protein
MDLNTGEFMKKIAILVSLIISTCSFASETLRDIFFKSRPAQFADILNIEPGLPLQDRSAHWQCGKIELHLKKINPHAYWNSESVVNFFYDDSRVGELVGIDDLSNKTIVIRIIDNGKPIVEFSGYRTSTHIKVDRPTSVVFSNLTAFSYNICDERNN